MSAPAAPDLARIPAGDFLMGAADAEEDERPVHRVYVSEFFIGRFPVTHDEYARFVRATGYPAPAIRGINEENHHGHSQRQRCPPGRACCRRTCHLHLCPSRLGSGYRHHAPTG